MVIREGVVDPARPVYVISVAAGLLKVHPRTLRIYEEKGLVQPARRNNSRLYSESDLERVRMIRHLTQDLGVNLAGIKLLFQLEERLGERILERLYEEGNKKSERAAAAARGGGRG